MSPSKPSSPPHWEESQFYASYYGMVGGVLGMFAAISSLLYNILGSTLVSQHPLYLIQIYLTFPLGEKALELDGGLALVIGSCAYIATGMLLGVIFHLLLTYVSRGKGTTFRIGAATGMSISMWIVHYYVVLNWLQPALIGGNWIVEMVPAWVGATTHLVYGWTMLALYPFGQYHPYRRTTELQEHVN